MSAERPTRRRAITILAAASCAPLAGIRTAQADSLFQWRGIAMGADAGITFSGVDVARAQSAAQAVTAEIARLEAALSLFRDESEISRLNRNGALTHPSADMRAALELSQRIAAETGGLFDPTVQSLWEAHADWFSTNVQAGLPPDSIIVAARRRVDWQGISCAADHITLRSGQRITLNGLGQGYVTDRVAGLLRARGFAHVLVDLGEQCALEERADGSPWMIARAGMDPIALKDGALATSEANGCVFGADGAAHHLFDPRTGRSAARWRRIIVHHRSAAIADALSTALYAATAQEAARIVGRFPGIMVWATGSDGRESGWSTPPVEGVVLAPTRRG